MVTGDEKWILYKNVQRKRTWKTATEGAEPVAKTGLHPMKVLLCIWWDRKGIIYFELLRRGETITADKYCEQLTRLAAAIREKRPILANRKGVIFHHDNARPHVAQQTLRKLQELQWEILQHPPYSPDIFIFKSGTNLCNHPIFISIGNGQSYNCSIPRSGSAANVKMPLHDSVKCRASSVKASE
ncbi:histone-lysine N-methyltransferase SETMAR-like [Polyergus mexicanus]|uniref:histone-lysine N-methyltransferase SETMAR-like n=1 Tax=Polyergus mexicanus TaxID=615972 RepID=UPI0038B5D4F6